MVSYALAAMLLPLAMAGYIHQQPMMNMNQGYGVQMTGYVQPGGQMQQMNMQQMQQMQQQQQGNNQWWGMTSEEDYEAYLKWCEERRMAIAEQEQQQELLHEIEERAEERKRKAAREVAMKEARSKREAMVAQWRMWQAQLTQAEEYTGKMDKYMNMKVKYMFSLTMDFLKFCRCSDYTAHLQRYLIHDGETYQPGNAEDYSLDELEGIDTTNVDAVAQRLATLSEQDQIKIFFHGIINAMCTSVKGYVEQVKVWENQYNFMGI